VNTRPLLVALPLDHETPDILAAAAELARRLAAPVVVLHAIPKRSLESEQGIKDRISEARSDLDPHLAPLRAAGVTVQDVIVERGYPAETVILTAPRLATQMVVVGGGRPATVRRWTVGSVAEAVVRQSSVPVWVARGKPPGGRPLLCPVDLSPESKVGLKAAIRTARLFEVPLSLISVVDADEPKTRVDAESTVRRRVDALLAEHDLEGLAVTLNVSTGDPAELIVDAADDAGLLVVASRGYDPLVHDSLGPVTSRALRHSRCSALTIRVVSEGHQERERNITQLADLYASAMQLIGDGRAQEALPLLESLAEEAVANAAIQDALGIALERVGRKVEATSRRELAALIRERIG